MRKIILERPDFGTIPFSGVNEHEPVFAKKDGKLIGMAVKENNGWIIRLGGSAGACGHHKTLYDCLKSCLGYAPNYEFFIE